MTREKLFEFAEKKGWDKFLEVIHDTHSFPEIAVKLKFKRREGVLWAELRKMQSFALLHIVSNTSGRPLYIPTFLGIKFLQEQNKKKGLTFSCLLCGTTTGVPHLCPKFYPEFR